mmetsp:Transcript_4143/g.9332  ORF Transcript_4143/g.9332 Transcript_4143/m.9332 type:complete len:415 (-) Transcript_4143:628-1872(-)
MIVVAFRFRVVLLAPGRQPDEVHAHVHGRDPDEGILFRGAKFQGPRVQREFHDASAGSSRGRCSFADCFRFHRLLFRFPVHVVRISQWFLVVIAFLLFLLLHLFLLVGSRKRQKELQGLPIDPHGQTLQKAHEVGGQLSRLRTLSPRGPLVETEGEIDEVVDSIVGQEVVQRGGTRDVLDQDGYRLDGLGGDGEGGEEADGRGRVVGEGGAGDDVDDEGQDVLLAKEFEKGEVGQRHFFFVLSPSSSFSFGRNIVISGISLLRAVAVAVAVPSLSATATPPRQPPGFPLRRRHQFGDPSQPFHGVAFVSFVEAKKPRRVVLVLVLVLVVVSVSRRGATHPPGEIFQPRHDGAQFFQEEVGLLHRRRRRRRRRRGGRLRFDDSPLPHHCLLRPIPTPHPKPCCTLPRRIVGVGRE